MRTEHAFFRGIQEVVRTTISTLFAHCSMLDLLIVSVMAGIGEEVFFRAFLQGWLGGFVGPWIALVLVSALFGLAHYVSRGYAIVAGLIGLYLGVLQLVTGNLFVAIAVHALFDFVALVWLSQVPFSPAAERGEANRMPSSKAH